MFSKVYISEKSPEMDYQYLPKLIILKQRAEAFHADYVQNFIPLVEMADFENFRLFNLNKAVEVNLFFLKLYRSLATSSRKKNYCSAFSTCCTAASCFAMSLEWIFMLMSTSTTSSTRPVSS